MRLVLLGDPVAHSRSPAMQQAALDALGISGSYQARRVDAAGMRAAVAEIRSGGLDGANVTMPHKRLAAELADHVSAEAGRARSVNTLVGEGGAVAGYSTDVDGFRAAWKSAGMPERGPVLVLGAGGAAAAALVALEDRASIYLQARRPQAARELLEALDCAATPVPWGEMLPGAVVVNATPLGMHGEPLPAGVMEGGAGLFDMAYGAGVTPAVAEARRRLLPVVDGLDMLLAQAAASFTLWTGRAAPVEAMRRAL